ncbi:hypothetical protein Pan258_50780 [Symmachiella dynata]|uniref:CehA/McbA family metallohydrolase n=1 Tax=Symmachiella dynata TaxID=2527995 RepID=UPI001188298E|nr:CehA/McbA family metallohydrolase [Symmachiella dynata]QDT50995.1 hypothetical protein Pan258_50780 [Symmachiella dynata]
MRMLNQRWTCLLFAQLCLLANLPAAMADETTPVRFHVVDADSNTPLPCRVYLRSAAGTDYHVKSADSAGSAVTYDVKRSAESFEKHTTVSAHPFTANLPPGDYTVTVERGKEYRLAKKTITVGTAPVEETIRLERWVNMAERGWYSGDTHVHRTVAELPNVMLAEDLNVALPLSYWVRDAYTPPAQGDKSVPAKAELIRVDATHVIWPLNTEYELFSVNGKRHTLGAVFVLNQKQPLRLAAPPVAPIAAEARRQGALLDLDKHSWPWSMMLVPVMDVDLFELSNNHIWRTQFFFKQWTIEQLPPGWEIETDGDGFTERGWTDFGLKTYYALLNCGFNMRPTAGTASGVHPVPLGFGRVYVHLPDGFSYDKWMAGLDAGQSFVTTGPMLPATFNGKPAGTTFVHDAPTSVRIEATVLSDTPLESVEIIKNGEIIRTIAPTAQTVIGNHHEQVINETIPVEGTSWIAVRCFSRPLTGDRRRFAHTAPVHITIKDRPLHPRQFETQFLTNLVKQELVRNRGVLSDDELAEYERALQVYRKLHATAIPSQ